jgi:hypothetical protein
MKYVFGKLGVVCIIIVCFTGTWAHGAEWKKIGESDGITGYTRATPRSKVEQMKGVGIIDAPVPVVEALIRDVPAATEFMYKCKESSFVNTTEHKSSKDAVYFYNVTSMPYPVSSRDVVARSDYSIDKATGAVYVHTEGIKSDYNVDGQKVRMPLLVSDFILVPRGPDKTEVSFITLADPGGNLPAFVVNAVTKNLSIQTITGMREMVKKDKYRKAKTVVTTTLHE